MRIFEKDLFNFIFHPKSLMVSKFIFIKSHQIMFRNELSILIKSSEVMEQTLGTPILYKIKDKIMMAEAKRKKLNRI